MEIRSWNENWSKNLSRQRKNDSVFAWEMWNFEFQPNKKSTKRCRDEVGKLKKSEPIFNDYLLIVLIISLNPPKFLNGNLLRPRLSFYIWPSFF
jgi:hypothetical protein